jgi:hypothetical protein
MKVIIILIGVGILAPINLMSQKSDIIVTGEYLEVLNRSTGDLVIGEYFTSVRIETAQIIKKYDRLNELTIIKYPNYPKIGTEVKEGLILNYKGEIIQVAKSHVIDVSNPKDNPELFIFYRPEGAGLQWIINEKVSKDDIRIYKDISYSCLKNHLTSQDLSPDKTIDKLWKITK